MGSARASGPSTVGALYSLGYRHLLARTDAENAHRAAFAGLRATYAATGRVPGVPAPDPILAGELFGRPLPSPLGLAAGFDKNAEGIDALAALGFGAIEIGTVTGQAQPGNVRPRLFRLPQDNAIINRMGFNNDGSQAVEQRLRARAEGKHSDALLGVNIGKTKAVAVPDATQDYVLSASRLAAYADYLVVNVSSPNTPGLRDLQAVESLRPLLAAVKEAADRAASRDLPLLVKIAPDLADDDIAAIAALVPELCLAGVVATNTTISREGLQTPAEVVSRIGAGGLSGPILRARSMEVLGLLRQLLPRESVVISVGGVSGAADVLARLEAGAQLVQAYTGLIHGGPLWVADVNRQLAAHRRRSS